MFVCVIDTSLMNDRGAGLPSAERGWYLVIPLMFAGAGLNDDARPLALQVALLVPLLAALIGLLSSIRMMRLPDPAPLAR
ncbi:MAG TPA: hypothetical protein VF125_07390 [Solirubrobacterales bacterium]